MKIKNIKKNAIVSILTLAELFMLSSCAKKVNCDIERDHVHLYESEEGLEIFSAKEKTYLNGVFSIKYNRTDEYKYVSALEEKYYETLNKNSLIDIKDNYEVLNLLYPKLDSYTEYRYRYQEAVYHHTYDSDGNISSTYVTYETRYSWTKDVNHSGLTGESRVITFAYCGYKIYYDEVKRKYKIEDSGYYETIDELLAQGYTCCNTNYFRKEIDQKDITHDYSLKIN